MPINSRILNLLPDTTVIVSVTLAYLLTHLFPVARASNPFLDVIGWPMVVAGIIAAFYTISVIRSKNTTSYVTDIPPALITKGLYAFSRNPFYLSYVIITLGVACVFGSLTAFIGPLLCVAVMQFIVIPAEEKQLQATHSEAYKHYKSRVRRWI